MEKEKCEELASIICNFRSGEITPIDGQHVEKWINQFDESVRDAILEEMIFVFSDWYLTHDFILEKYLDKIPSILQKKYGFESEYDTCKNVSFVNIQTIGQSQKMLISELKKLKQEQYGISLQSEIKESFSHYAYIDDGFYSGSRARKDIKELAYQLKPCDTLDIFYLVMCISSLSYTKNVFKRIEEECKISINLYSFARIDNDRIEHYVCKNGTTDVYWTNKQMSLWPSVASGEDAEVNAYYEYLKTLSSNYEKIPYRTSHWLEDPGIFSSVERRTLVEHEFLKKGIMIIKAYQNNKGIYPLGYNLWPSFGFGVLFATDFNVPNNAPLVIWANTNWYPLLPRRVNNHNDAFDAEDNIDFAVGDISRDQYNMCPDCGRIFGLDDDGGNGFCIDCAWNH